MRARQAAACRDGAARARARHRSARAGRAGAAAKAATRKRSSRSSRTRIRTSLPRSTARPAAARAAAIELAKIAQRLPALLVAEIDLRRERADRAAAGRRRRRRGDEIRPRRSAFARDRRARRRCRCRAGISTRFVVFRDSIGGGSVAVIVGEPDFSKPVPVRLHSACLTGDVFGSSRCDCGDQLRLATKRLERRRRRRHPLSRAGRPRPRARQQDARLCAAGRGPRHGRRQHHARLRRRRARLRHRGAHAAASSAARGSI